VIFLKNIVNSIKKQLKHSIRQDLENKAYQHYFKNKIFDLNHEIDNAIHYECNRVEELAKSEIFKLTAHVAMKNNESFDSLGILT